MSTQIFFSSSALAKEAKIGAIEPNEADLFQAIADALAMGQVENIVIFLRSEPQYTCWADRLLEDERLAVRLGLAVLFEYLAEQVPEIMILAIPGLAAQLQSPLPHIRGDAAGLLLTIASPEALALLPPLRQDPSPEIAAMVRDALST